MGEEGRDPLLILGRTSLRVYMFMLARNRPIGVRELQRALGFKSPSTARHHLERLVELGLARREGGAYRVVPPRGLLSLLYSVRGKLIPRSLFVAGFLLFSSLSYALLPGRDPIALIVMITAGLIELGDAIYMYRSIRKLLEGG